LHTLDLEKLTDYIDYYELPSLHLMLKVTKRLENCEFEW
jgi:hypothetical protein